MATGNDENPNNGPQNPFAYVLIPILGFGFIVAVITCYRYRRKKQQLAQLGDEALYQRHLEEGRRRRTQLDRGANLTIIAGERGARRAAGRSRRLGLGAGLGSREEGLNELGEAPPAYTANAPKPPSEAGVEQIELTPYSQATAEAGMSRSPPSYGEEPTAEGTTSGAGAGDAARLSDEMRRDAPANAATSRGSDTEAADEGNRGDAAQNATTSGVGTTTTTRTNDENSDDGTGNTTVATTTTPTTTMTTPESSTTATSTTGEPTRPPRAVLH